MEYWVKFPFVFLSCLVLLRVETLCEYADTGGGGGGSFAHHYVWRINCSTPLLSVEKISFSIVFWVDRLMKHTT